MMRHTSVYVPSPVAFAEVTGAGDSMPRAFCHMLLQGGSPEEAARFGHAAAALTVASPHTVRPDLTHRLVRSTLDSTLDSPHDSPHDAPPEKQP